MLWLVNSGLRFGRLVLAAAIGIFCVGLVQLRDAAVDIYPEFDPPAVQVQAEALGLSAEEVEQLITVPLEQDLLNGIPWLEHIRSQSMPGLSAIDLEFEPGTDLYQARQMVQERMTQAKALPNVGTPPIMVQPTSSTSRIAMIAMTSQTVSPIQMSVLARWQIQPRLMSIPGVAKVSIWGLRDRQLQVQVDPNRLRSHAVSLTQLIESTGNALWVSPLSFVEASTPGTGGFVETPNQRLGVQHIQPITTTKQLAAVAVEGSGDPPLRIGDLATVREDHQPLIGDASIDGTASLMLVVERFPGANTAQVTGDIEAALDAMAPGLSGITLDPQVFRPATYLSTALSHLGVVGLVAVAMLIAAAAVMLLSWRVALIVAFAVPLSLVSAAYVLHLRGETLTTMTLVGVAAALAVVVDDTVGDVDEIRRQLGASGSKSRPAVVSVVTEVVVSRRGPLLVAAAVVIIGLTPLLLAPGIASAFVRPMVLSYVLALGTSLIVALLVTPTLAVLLLGDHGKARRLSPIDRWLIRGFDRAAPPIMAHPGPVLVASVLLAGVGLATLTQVKSGPVLPTLQDRNVLVRLEAAPGTSLTDMNRITSAIAVELRAVPGVDSAGAHVGRAITADEVVDVDAAEIWVRLATDADYSDTLAAVKSVVRGYPGLHSSVRTYAADRVVAVQGSAQQRLVVRVYGQDLTVLGDTADDISKVIGTIPGVLDPRTEPQVSEPTVEIEVDLVAAQKYGLRPGDVRREASTLISGLTVGSLYEQQKIFDVVVWGGPATRQGIASLQSLLIDTPSGKPVRLGEVARVRVAPDPVAISHDAVSRSVDVTAMVVGRNIDDVAADVTQRLRGMAMPYEYRAEVLDDALDQQASERRIVALALVAGLVMLLLLQAASGSWRAGLVLFASFPLAVLGVVFAAPLVGGARSIGVLAALFAVLAVTIRQSLILLRRAQQLRREPEATAASAAHQATREIAPSVLRTAVLTAAILLAPAVLDDLAGLEILHPFAVATICGLLTATIVVLLVVPTFDAALARETHPAPSTATADQRIEVTE